MHEEALDFDDGTGLLFEHAGVISRLPLDLLEVIENQFLSRDFGGELYHYLSFLVTVCDATKRNQEIAFETQRFFEEYRRALEQSHGKPALNRLELSFGIRIDDLERQRMRLAFSGVNMGSVVSASAYMSAYLSAGAMEAKKKMERDRGIRFWTLQWREAMDENFKILELFS